jgi:hypothetical protein
MLVKSLIADFVMKNLMTMKKLINLCVLCLTCFICFSQEEQVERKGFQKDNLFSGGSISLSFFNNTFLIGASPIFGYRLANWVDAGVVVNFQYTSIRDYSVFNDRLRQSLYGGGVFTRLYPVRFLFAQANLEHNFITQKYIPASNSGAPSYSATTSANSLLVGGGYTSGRSPDGRSPFFYMSLLFDVSGNTNSPYTDGAGRTIPIIRAGFNIPLFQNY